MAEFRSGLLLNVGFETLPVVLGGVYFVTIGTNRDQLLELVNFSCKPNNSISHTLTTTRQRARSNVSHASVPMRVTTTSWPMRSRVNCRIWEATASSSAMRIFISLTICGAPSARHDPRRVAIRDHPLWSERHFARLRLEVAAGLP